MDSRDLLPSHLRTLAAGISNPDPPSRGRTPTPAPTIRSRRRSRSFSGERRRSLAGPGAGIFDALTGWFSSAAMTISTGATERGGKGLAIHNGEHVGWFGVSRAKDRVDQERGQESIQERSTTMNKTSSYASSSSTSSSTGPSLRSGSAEILPTFRAAAAQPYYVKRGEGTTRRDSPEYEPELYGDNPSLDDLADLSYYGSESARTPLLQSLTQRHPHPTSPMPNNYPPEYAPCRYSSTRSLDSAKFMSKSLTLEDIVPDLQRTSLRFTRKFPKLPVQMTRTGIGYSVLEGDLGGFGIEDIGRWTGFKWILLASVSTVFAMGIAGLMVVLCTWFRSWSLAHIVAVAEHNILVFTTLASVTLIITSLVGTSGTLLNNRPMLSFYTLLLWPSFISCLIVGYTAYKRRAFNIDGKLSGAWYGGYAGWGDEGRAIIQNTFHCCGWYSPDHGYMLTSTCWPRSPLHGCKGPLTRWEKQFLTKTYTIIFALVPIHVINIFVSLLCSNHVNRSFGKGLPPKAYRLSLADVQANAERIKTALSATRIPYEPERIEGKKAKDFKREYGFPMEGDSRLG